MERPPPPSEPAPEGRKSSQRPLYLRMYSQRHLVDLVRLVGYCDIPLDDMRERVKPLVETYGRSVMEAATREILIVDDGQSPPVVRLTEEARRLAVQLLGRPPQPGGVPPAVQVTPPPHTPDAPRWGNPTSSQRRRRRTTAKQETDGQDAPPESARAETSDAADSQASTSKSRSRKPAK